MMDLKHTDSITFDLIYKVVDKYNVFSQLLCLYMLFLFIYDHMVL